MASGEENPELSEVEAISRLKREGRTDGSLGQWLHRRFGKHFDHRLWDRMTAEDRAWWEHEAAAVRRAVQRGGFKEEEGKDGETQGDHEAQ